MCGWLSAWDLTNVTAEDVNEPAAEGLVLTRLLQAHRRPTPEVELALNSACDIIDDAALDVSPACELLDGSRRQRTLQIPLYLSSATLRPPNRDAAKRVMGCLGANCRYCFDN